MATPEEFVKAWQAASSVKEVAKILNQKEAACYTRAANYRRRGIPLKKHNCIRDRLDLNALVALAKKTNK